MFITVHLLMVREVVAVGCSINKVTRSMMVNGPMTDAAVKAL